MTIKKINVLTVDNRIEQTARDGERSAPPSLGKCISQKSVVTWGREQEPVASVSVLAPVERGIENKIN